MSRFRWQTQEVTSRQMARCIERTFCEVGTSERLDEQWRSRRAWCPCIDAAVDALAEVLRYRRVQSPVCQHRHLVVNSVLDRQPPVDASAVWHGTASVPGGRFWLHCSVHAATSACCWLARHRVPSCSRQVLPGSHCRSVCVPDQILKNIVQFCV